MIFLSGGCASVRISMQAYKSFRVAVTISTTEVNTQTHSQTHRQHLTDCTISSASRAKIIHVFLMIQTIMTYL